MILGAFMITIFAMIDSFREPKLPDSRLGLSLDAGEFLRQTANSYKDLIACMTPVFFLCEIMSSHVKISRRFITGAVMPKASEIERAVKLMQTAGVVRAGEFASRGIHPMTLTRLLEQGVVERDGRGLYRLAGAEVSENYSLIQAAKRVPKGVICLLSALRIHNLTTQKPFEVWMAIERGTRRPVADAPPLRIHYSPREA